MLHVVVLFCIPARNSSLVAIYSNETQINSVLESVGSGHTLLVNGQYGI